MAWKQPTRRLRELPAYKNVAIVAMTGNAFNEDRKRCLDTCMSDFIVKPFTPKQLLEAVSHLL